MPRIISGVQVDDSVWLGLRFCQKKAIKTVFRYLQRGEKKRSCLISMPTGSGKSGVISVVSQYISNAKILVLCHRRAVCDQLVRDISGSFFLRWLATNALQKKCVWIH